MILWVLETADSNKADTAVAKKEQGRIKGTGSEEVGRAYSGVGLGGERHQRAEAGDLC